MQMMHMQMVQAYATAHISAENANAANECSSAANCASGANNAQAATMTHLHTMLLMFGMQRLQMRAPVMQIVQVVQIMHRLQMLVVMQGITTPYVCKGLTLINVVFCMFAMLLINAIAATVQVLQIHKKPYVDIASTAAPT